MVVNFGRRELARDIEERNYPTVGLTVVFESVAIGGESREKMRHSGGIIARICFSVNEAQNERRAIYSVATN